MRDRAYRAQYPGWEASSAAGGDGILRRVEGPAATETNRWTGNRDGYEDATTQALLHGYWSSIRGQYQLQALQKINQMAVEQVPIFILFTTADPIAVRTGVKVLDDHPGGEGGGAPFGTYTRNAHLWDLA